jgi:Transposase domain (DUF772)
MLCLIPIAGGLLIMMGQHDRSEALFYYFRLEDQVPETHLLRLIDRHVSFAFVRERLRDRYSENGRPSIDPELLLRILLIGYLYGITSERKLVEELRMHLASRWFSITLSKAAWLVLFEWLTTSNAEWSKANPDSYSPSAKPLQLTAEHPQRIALWWLENAIENRLTFLPNAELVEEAKRLLADRD